MANTDATLSLAASIDGPGNISVILAASLHTIHADELQTVEASRNPARAAAYNETIEADKIQTIKV